MGSPRVTFGEKSHVLLYKDVKYLQIVVAEGVDS